MTALAEALLAAQRQAIPAVAKAFVAEAIDANEAKALLNQVGCLDTVDVLALLQTWDVLRQFGAPAPNGNSRPAALDEPATKAQLDFIAKLSDDKGRVVQTDGMTKAQASAAIEALKRDEEVPF